MKNLVLICSMLFVLALLGTLTPARAQWSTNPIPNNPISAASNNQGHQTITSDGTGGAIMIWQDYRSGLMRAGCRVVCASIAFKPTDLFK